MPKFSFHLILLIMQLCTFYLFNPLQGKSMIILFLQNSHLMIYLGALAVPNSFSISFEKFFPFDSPLQRVWVTISPLFLLDWNLNHFYIAKSNNVQKWPCQSGQDNALSLNKMKIFFLICTYCANKLLLSLCKDSILWLSIQSPPPPHGMGYELSTQNIDIDIVRRVSK